MESCNKGQARYSNHLWKDDVDVTGSCSFAPSSPSARVNPKPAGESTGIQFDWWQKQVGVARERQKGTISTADFEL